MCVCVCVCGVCVCVVCWVCVVCVVCVCVCCVWWVCVCVVCVYVYVCGGCVVCVCVCLRQWKKFILLTTHALQATPLSQNVMVRFCLRLELNVTSVWFIKLCIRLLILTCLHNCYCQFVSLVNRCNDRLIPLLRQD